MPKFRLLSAVTLAAAIIVSVASAAPASAQVCPYNSTQGSCACPTSGGGTTCFGGQLYRSTDSSCQADARPCSSNQQWNCSTEACECNTTSYPCGGCTAASSTVGATCGAPTNGKYTNVCGACSCPAGTTLCGASNTCVTNLTCPAGTTFDPCTNTCGTPYVLLNPASTQSGAIKVDGNITTTTGNTFLGGDLYLPSGKAIRVDGSGVTTLSIGNWGGGGTGVNLNIPNGSQMCFGAACRASWPSTADFDPTYINANGDTMTGTLNLTGTSTNLYVGGSVGVGTTSPGAKVDIVGPASGSGISLRVGGGGDTVLGSGGSLFFDNNYNYGTGSYIRPVAANTQAFFTAGVERMRIDSAGNVGIGTTTPGVKLDVNGTARFTGFVLSSGAGAGKVLTSDASGNGTWQTPAGVTSVNAGTGISVSPTTGNVVVSNTGVTSATGGTDTSVSASTGAVTFSNTSTLQTVTNRGATTSNAINVGSGSTTYGISAQGTTGAVSGQTSANNATAGYFNALNGGSNNTGVNAQGSYIGVFGAASSGNAGVEGLGGYYGTFGQGNQYGVYGTCSTSGCTGTYGTGTSYGVYGSGSASNGIGVYGTGLNDGVYGVHTGSGIGFGVYGDSNTSYGVYGHTATAAYGVYGAGSSALAGVYGTSNTGYGVQGYGGPSSAGGQFSGGTGVNVSGTSYGVYSSGGTNYFSSNVGVGTSSPGAALDVEGPGNAAVKLAGSYVGDNWDGILHIRSGGSTVSFDGGDNVAINTTANNGYGLDVNSSGNGLYVGAGGQWVDTWTGGNTSLEFGAGGHRVGFVSSASTAGGLYVAGCDNYGNCPAYTTFQNNGTVSFGGDISAENNSWGSGTGWIYCPVNGQCTCPNGMYVYTMLNYYYYYAYGYIACAKP